MQRHQPCGEAEEQHKGEAREAAAERPEITLENFHKYLKACAFPRLTTHPSRDSIARLDLLGLAGRAGRDTQGQGRKLKSGYCQSVKLGGGNFLCSAKIYR
jgi:hypothetical protein